MAARAGALQARDPPVPIKGAAEGPKAAEGWDCYAPMAILFQARCILEGQLQKVQWAGFLVEGVAQGTGEEPLDVQYQIQPVEGVEVRAISVAASPPLTLSLSRDQSAPPLQAVTT